MDNRGKLSMATTGSVRAASKAIGWLTTGKGDKVTVNGLADIIDHEINLPELVAALREARWLLDNAECDLEYGSTGYSEWAARAGNFRTTLTKWGA